MRWIILENACFVPIVLPFDFTVGALRKVNKSDRALDYVLIPIELLLNNP